MVTRLKYSTNKQGILAILAAVVCSASGQVIQPTLLNDGVYTVQTEGSKDAERLFTINDGNTPERYISYLNLDGSQGGIRAPLRELANLNTSTDYTLGMWIKPTEAAFGQQDLTIFEFEGSLQCYVTAPLNALTCQSPQSSKSKLNAKGLSGLNPNRGHSIWTHILVKGLSQNVTSSMILVQQNGKTPIQATGKYVSLQQIKRPFQVCLLGCDPRSAFIGGIREFIFLSANVGTQQALGLKNNLPLWNSKMLGYFRIQGGLMDFYRNANLTFDHPNGAIIAIDYSSNDVCNAFTNQSIYTTFTKQTQLVPILVDQRWQLKPKGWQYSASFTLFLAPDTCSTLIPSQIEQACHLLHIQDAFTLFQPRPNEVAIVFNNLPVAQRIRSQSLFVPHNQWITIQLTMEQYSGYVLQAYDILGELISSTSENRDLSVQNIKSKTVLLFSGFEGIPQSVYLSTERVPRIPFVPIIKDSCIVSLEFAAQGISNKCNHSKYGELRVQMTGSGITGMYKNGDYGFNSGKVIGKFNTTNYLFDGTACNDGNQLLATNSQYSAVTTDLHNQSFTSATVEFWFKRPSSNETEYLFQAWANKSSQEVFSIFTVNNGLLCTSLVQSQVNLSDYTPLTQGWVHVSCSFDTQQISSTLFYRDLINETQYDYSNPIPRANASISHEYLKLYVGNNRMLNRGTPQLMVRELRLWASMRSATLLKENRFRQILIQGAPSLVVYIRFSEGSLKEYNVASPTSDITFSDVSLVSTISQPLICPIDTYYDSDRGVCFTEPLSEVYALVYPSFVNGSQVWVFDASLTGSALNFKWDFGSDLLLAKYANASKHTAIVQIAANLFRDEVSYPISVTVSNLDGTYSKTKELLFLPVSCQYYTNTGSTQMTGPLSNEDIIFSLDLKTHVPYCVDVTFFNTLLLESVSIKVVPSLQIQPNIILKRVNDSRVQVTIPKGEQFKLDIGKSVLNFVIDLKYTNKFYSANVNSSGLTFQSVIHQLKLASLLQGGETMVQPVLRVLNENGVILKGESAMLDGSDSYVIGKTDAEKYQNISFFWQCEAELTTFCLNKTGAYLTIKQTDFERAGGRFNEDYQIVLRVQYTRESGAQSSFKAAKNITFLSIGKPEFNITTNLSSILVTKERQDIAIAFKDPAIQPSDYNIEWTLDPPVSSPEKSMTNGTVLTLLNGSLASLTTYSLTVRVTHKILAFASFQQTQSFTTRSPPVNGGLTLTPMFAFEGKQTNFTLVVRGWESEALPIQLRVSQINQTATGNIVFSVLTLRLNTSGWLTLDQPSQLAEGSTFNFSVTTNKYPLLVEVRDQTNEAYKRVFKIDEVPEENTTATDQDNATFSNESETLSNDTQVEFGKFLLFDNTADQTKYTSEDINNLLASNELALSQDAQNLTSTLISILESVATSTDDPALITIDGIEKATQLLSASLAWVQYAGADSISTLRNLQMEILGNLLNALQNKVGLGHNLRAQVYLVKQGIVRAFCPEFGETKQLKIQTPKVYSYMKRTSNGLMTVSSTDGEVTELNEKTLADGQCLYAFVYPSKSYSTPKLVPLSKSLFEIGVIDSSFTALTQATKFTFSKVPDVIDPSHIQCMGLKDTDWDSTACSTVITGSHDQHLTVECRCLAVQNQLIGLFSPNLSTKQMQLLASQEKFTKQKETDMQVFYGMLAITVAFFANMLVIMRILDIRDKIQIGKTFKTPLEQEVYNKLEQNSQCNWKEHHFLILRMIRKPESQAFQAMYLRSNLVTNLLGYYSEDNSRIQRFIVAYMQHLFYFFIIILAFMKNSNDQSQLTILNRGLVMPGTLVFAGVFLLLPITGLNQVQFPRVPWMARFKWPLAALYLIGLQVSTYLQLADSIAANPYGFNLIITTLFTGSAVSLLVSPLIYSLWNYLIIKSFEGQSGYSCILYALCSHELIDLNSKINAIKTAITASKESLEGEEILSSRRPLGKGEESKNHIQCSQDEVREEDINVEYNSTSRL